MMKKTVSGLVLQLDTNKEKMSFSSQISHIVISDCFVVKMLTINLCVFILILVLQSI